VRRRPLLLAALGYVAALLAGFLLTRIGTTTPRQRGHGGSPDVSRIAAKAQSVDSRSQWLSTGGCMR
jgi:hypothetical protein